VLTQFSNAGDAFVDSFHVFLTYPFVDEVVGRDPQVARNLHMGDYTNLSVQLDISVTGGDGDTVNLPDPLPDPTDPCTTLKEVRQELGANVPLDELLEYVDNLQGLCDRAEEVIDQCLAKDNLANLVTCLENKLDVTVQDLTQGVLDDSCQLLGIAASQCPDVTGGGGGDDGGDGGVLPDVPDLDLLRAPFGPDPAGSGPTMGQLADHYDPALVSLLVPGMVTR
jgi:phospholipid/cholesterol/gamma-HCH transport system substrate-binding protein